MKGDDAKRMEKVTTCNENYNLKKNFCLVFYIYIGLFKRTFKNLCAPMNLSLEIGLAVDVNGTK